MQRAQRMLARAQQRDRPGLAAGQDALAQGREQAGAQHRRLAAARRTDEAQHRRARQAGHHLRHEPLAPEEERGVLGLERGEALEGADDDVRRDLRSLARGLQRDDDVARELVLGRAQPGAARRRAPGGTAQAADALGPRPLDRGLVDLARHAAAVLHQAGDRHLHVLARVRVEARDGGHVVGAERSERDRRVDARRPRARRRPAPWRGRAPAARRGPRPARAAPRPPPRRRGRRRRRRAASGAARVPRGRSRRARLPDRRRRRRAARWRGRGAPRPPAPRPAASSPCRGRRARARSARLRRARRATPRAARRARPDGPRAACPRRARPAAARIRAPGGSSCGSWRRIASCSSRSAGPGSTPICSTSADRACR